VNQPEHSDDFDPLSSITPLPFVPSLFYFGIPALIFVAGFYWLMPYLIVVGVSPGFAYLTGLTAPLTVLLAAAFIWLRCEGHPLTWNVMKRRFRLHRMDRRAWLYLAGATVAVMVGMSILGVVRSWLIDSGIMPIPHGLPAFLDPTLPPTTDIMPVYDPGGSHPWLTVLAMIVGLFINITAEELWWRGIVLPRQELAFGKWAWVIHGLMWAFFHIFKWWDVVTLLPVCLGIAFVCSKTKNTTPGIIIHTIGNGAGLIPIIIGLL
jgi:membrane protease YdiL (CAAX protease family)